MNLFGVDVVKFLFYLTVEEVSYTKSREGSTYSIFWKRGLKHKGESAFTAPKDDVIRLNFPLRIKSKLKKEKKKGGKLLGKSIKFTLREKTRGRSSDVSKGELNLTDYVDEDKDVVKTATVKIPYGTIKIAVHSRPEKLGHLKLDTSSPTEEDMITDTEDENSTRNDEKSDDDEDEESDKSDKSDKTKSFDESSEKTNTESTKSGSESDAELDDDSSDKESPRTPFDVEKAERENRELQEQVAQLKRRMDELNKMEVKVENNKSKMFLAVQRQRDKLLKEAHESEVELDDLKEELNEWTKKNKDIERESKENQSSFKKDKKMLEMAIQELQNRVDRADDSGDFFSADTSNRGKDKETQRMVAQMSQSLEAYQTKETDKFLIDHAILYSEPNYTVATPESVVILYKTLTNWTPDKNPSISTNISNALALASETAASIDDSAAMVYWCKVTCQLANLLKRDVCPKSISNGMDRAAAECRVRPITDKRKKERIVTPKFATRDEPREKLTVKNWDEFSLELCRVLCKSYLSLLESAFTRLDTVIIDAIFDNNDENLRSISVEGGATMKYLLKVIDQYKSELEEAGFDNRITRHFVYSIAQYIDAVVFNRILLNPKSNALKVKMSINMLETLFEKRGNFAQGELFKTVRQAADALAIGKEPFKNDGEMQNIVCPDLSTQQVQYLLKLNDSHDGRSIMIGPIMTTTDSKGPLFDTEVEGLDKRTKIGERFLTRKGLEFLKK